MTEAIKTEGDELSKVGLINLFPFFNLSSVRDHFGWSGSWPAGTSSPPPAPPPPLQLVQATNHQKILAWIFFGDPVGYLDYLGQTEWMNVFFFSWASSLFGLVPPAPNRRLRGEPATVNWGILEAVGSSVVSTLGCRHIGKKHTILGSAHILHAFGAVLFLFCSKTCFFCFRVIHN